MYLAKNNIIVKIKDSSSYAILNPLSGCFDLMEESEYRLLSAIQDGECRDGNFEAYLYERGYAYKSKEDHDAAVEKAYEEFNSVTANSQIQLMLVPTYACNLACTYCYQGRGGGSAQAVPIKNAGRPALITKEVVDAFFEYAKQNFSKNTVKPFITLFGGEPLINSPAQKEIISYIIDKCAEEGYELSAVTNGCDFTEYVDMLKKVKVKEIQFTLDGSKDVHDGRRATADNKGTFDRIVAGIEAAVENKMPVNLRSVVDLENIRDLVNLAEFLDKKGWLDLPPERFKTQIGRNYELFDCYAKPQHLMSQAELWGTFSLLSREYPILTKFHRPDFKGIRYLVDTGEMYMASFDTCPACKTEWVFDLHGNIYGCTASCGREEYLLGTFWPEVRLNENAVSAWKGRNVRSIMECRSCKYDVICGGGCGVLAANKHNGNVCSPDCRPVQELIETGVNHYIKEIEAMTGNGHSGSRTEQKNTEGCLICGESLVYSVDTASTESCVICGRKFDTNVKCTNGHYICDDCHGLDILGKVELLLSGSTEKNPVLLARKVFELPGLNMHGPEYHSIVPAVLVAAYLNNTGAMDRAKIKEAIRRGKSTPGGSCGYNGNCGAGVGAGIAAAIIEKATPMTGEARSKANMATGLALSEIGKIVGPRCCKRESVISIESFMKSTDYFSNMELPGYICTQYGRNNECAGIKCPYFPSDK